MILPWIDIAQVAFEAGFRGEAHAVAVALTQPESGRNPAQVNPSDPNGGSYGLWQVNGVHDPNASGVYPDKIPTAAWIERMKVPLENAKAAFRIWDDAGQVFTDWGAFTSALHLPYLGTARCALDGRARVATRDAKIGQLNVLLGTAEVRVAELQVRFDQEFALVAQLQGKIERAREELA